MPGWTLDYDDHTPQFEAFDERARLFLLIEPRMQLLF